jgi:hypothetical protein
MASTEETEAQLQAIEEEERAEAARDRARATAKKIERAALKKVWAEKTGGEELRKDEDGDWMMRDGITFTIVDTPRGFFVLKKAASIIFHRLTKSKFTDADQEEFFRSVIVQPAEWDEVVKLFDDWKGAKSLLLDAGVALYGTQLKERSKK